MGVLIGLANSTAIKATSNTAVGIASDVAVGIASRISKTAGGGVEAVGAACWGVNATGGWGVIGVSICVLNGILAIAISQAVAVG